MEEESPSSVRRTAEPALGRRGPAAVRRRAASGVLRRPSPAAVVPHHAAELFEAVDCGVIVVDEAGVIRYANRTAHEHLDALDRQLAGRSIREPGWSGAILVDEQGECRISTQDYAVAMIDELEDPKHTRTRFCVAY